LAFSNNVGYVGSYNRDTGGGYLPLTFFASQHSFDIGGVPKLTISSTGEAIFTGTIKQSAATSLLTLNDSNSDSSGSTNIFQMTDYANNVLFKIAQINGGLNAEINQVLNGNLDFKTNNTSRLTISSGGTVQIYGTASANSLNIDHDSGNNVTMAIPFLNTSQDFVIRNASDGVNLDYAATSWVSASDENIKENITSLDNVLDKIKNIRCVNYNLKDEKIYKKRLGFIAQDFQENFEEVTSINNNDVLGLRYTETIPILLKAIQEQQTIIEDLKARIEKLEL
jgi:hypothetical protein